MKILQVHNIYIGKTGEETVLEQERKVLEENGHQVVQYIKDNSNLQHFGFLEKMKMYSRLLSSKIIRKELNELINEEKPDICHVHNTFPIITPVVYKLCQQRGVPVIKTLHNYKMVCTNSLMFRNGEVCEVCLNKNLFNSVKYKCYRNSYLATAAQASVIQHHRSIGTWNNHVDYYVCLTDFQRDKLISGGLPESKAIVKPNFIGESGYEIKQNNFFLFVGKIDDYKGLQDLLYLFQQNSCTRFVLIGKSEKPDQFDRFSNVKYLGEQGREVVLENMSRCRAVVFPSKYYEGMPMVLLEAFSHRKPVISRDRGAMSSMIIHNYNGLKYEDVKDLVKWVDLLDKNSALAHEMGMGSYAEYLKKYSKEQGYKNLMDLYSEAISTKQKEAESLS